MGSISMNGKVNFDLYFDSTGKNVLTATNDPSVPPMNIVYTLTIGGNKGEVYSIVVKDGSTTLVDNGGLNNFVKFTVNTGVNNNVECTITSVSKKNCGISGTLVSSLTA